MKIQKKVSIVLISAMLCAGCDKSMSTVDVPNRSPSASTEENPEGTGVANGGGAIVRNGNILTLAQAGVKFEFPVQELLPDIIKDEVALTEKVINKLALSESARGSLLRSLLPQDDRRYFIIKKEELSPEKKAKLIAAYLSVMNEPVEGEITLVAVTIGKETFLLPEFFELSDLYARTSIIFHEALWVRNPKLKLSSVLRAEIAFENLLRSGQDKQKLIYDFKLFQTLKDALEDRHLGVVGAIRKDFEKGSLVLNIPEVDGVTDSISFNKPVFSAKVLIGEAALNQLQIAPFLNRDLVFGYWYDLISLNKSIRFLREIHVELSNMEILLFKKSEGDGFIHAGPGNVDGFEFDLSRPMAPIDRECYCYIMASEITDEMRITAERFGFNFKTSPKYSNFHVQDTNKCRLTGFVFNKDEKTILTFKKPFYY